MSYEKQTWATGEVITADKLNHMEDGISQSGGGGGEYDYKVVLRYSDDCEGIKSIKAYGLPLNELITKAENGEVINVAHVEVFPLGCEGASVDAIKVVRQQEYEMYEMMRWDESAQADVSYGKCFSADSTIITASYIEMDGTHYAYTYNPQTREYVLGEQLPGK